MREDSHVCTPEEIPARLPGVAIGGGPAIIRARFVDIATAAAKGDVSIDDDVIFHLLPSENL